MSERAARCVLGAQVGSPIGYAQVAGADKLGRGRLRSWATEIRELRHDLLPIELAIVALSASEIVESLAMSAGFLGALDELPLDSWAAWRDKHLRKVSASPGAVAAGTPW